MLITDAQVHLFEAETADRPWPKEAGRVAPPAKHAQEFGARQMLGAMEAVGVDRAVIVPPVWAGDDNAPALAMAARHPGRFAVMGRFDPYAPDAQERLDHWLAQPHMLGIRMSGRWTATAKTSTDALADPALAWYWAACERLGIPLAILALRHTSRLAPIAARHPRLALIVDHMSIVRGGSVAAAFAVFDDLLALARYPRVYVKVGNAPNVSAEAYPFSDVHPYLLRLVQAFGAQRLLWEADITQLAKHTYAECLRLWQEGLPFLSATEREWILGRTCAEALNWREARQAIGF